MARSKFDADDPASAATWLWPFKILSRHRKSRSFGLVELVVARVLAYFRSYPNFTLTAQIGQA